MSEQDRRRAILVAAERLLLHYGVNKTTIADIAREADIGVGTVYLEFSSKSVIIGELAASRHRSLLDRLQEAATGEGDFRQRLITMLDTRIERFLELADTEGHAADLVHCESGPVAQSFEEYLDGELDVFADFLAEADAAGAFAVDDPRQTARALLSAYARFAPPTVFETPPPDAEALAKTLHTLVLDGLVRR